MGRSTELIKNTSIVAFGRLCTKLLSFFLLPLYTAVLSTSDYGISDLFSAYTSLLLPLVVFQIEDALFRFSIDVRDSEVRKQTLVSTVFCFCAGQCLIFSLIFLVVNRFFTILYPVYFLVNLIVSIFAGALLQLTRGFGDNLSYALASFLTALVSVGLNIVLVLCLRRGVVGLFVSGIAANVICICFVLLRQRVLMLFRVRRFSLTLLKDLLAYSLPLVPNYLFWWILGASDKTVVNYFLGVAQNGILSVSQKFSSAYTTFYSIFNLTWTENATLHRNDADHESYFSGIIDTSFRLLLSAFLGIVALVALLFPMLIHENFSASYDQIPIYMLSSLLYSVIGIYSVVYIAYKKTAKIAWTSMLAAGINLLVNLSLIGKIGLFAASLSSVAAYGLLLGIRLVDIRRLARIRISLPVVLSGCAVTAVTFLAYYTADTAGKILALGLVCGFALVINLKTLKALPALLPKRGGARND